MIIDSEYSLTLSPASEYTFEAAAMVAVYERQISGDDTSFKFLGTVRQGSKFGSTTTTGEIKLVPRRARTFFEHSTGLPTEESSETTTGDNDTSIVVATNRWHMETNNRWVGWSKSHGFANENAEQNFGALPAEPNTIWDALGVFVPSGKILKKFSIVGRLNNAEVTDIAFRLYHYSGAFDGTWEDEASTTRTLVASSDNAGFTSDKIHKHESTLDFTAPADGFLVLNIAPVGTLTAERFLYANSHFQFE